jgi:hypothetical protein
MAHDDEAIELVPTSQRISSEEADAESAEAIMGLTTGTISLADSSATFTSRKPVLILLLLLLINLINFIDRHPHLKRLSYHVDTSSQPSCP